MTASFYSLHAQGFVRIAASTPRIAVGDPAANADETLALMHEGEARAVDLMLFPELGFSAYAITADMNDPVVQAIHKLLEHASATDARLERLVAQLRRDGVEVGDAKATAERFDPSPINKMLE